MNSKKATKRTKASLRFPNVEVVLPSGTRLFASSASEWKREKRSAILENHSQWQLGSSRIMGHKKIGKKKYAVFSLTLGRLAEGEYGSFSLSQLPTDLSESEKLKDFMGTFF